MMSLIKALAVTSATFAGVPALILAIYYWPPTLIVIPFCWMTFTLYNRFSK